jgi:hypothetical protein
MTRRQVISPLLVSPRPSAQAATATSAESTVNPMS